MSNIGILTGAWVILIGHLACANSALAGEVNKSGASVASDSGMENAREAAEMLSCVSAECVEGRELMSRRKSALRGHVNRGAGYSRPVPTGSGSQERSPASPTVPSAVMSPPPMYIDHSGTVGGKGSNGEGGTKIDMKAVGKAAGAVDFKGGGKAPGAGGGGGVFIPKGP